MEAEVLKDCPIVAEEILALREKNSFLLHEVRSRVRRCDWEVTICYVLAPLCIYRPLPPRTIRTCL